VKRSIEWSVRLLFVAFAAYGCGGEPGERSRTGSPSMTQGSAGAAPVSSSPDAGSGGAGGAANASAAAGSGGAGTAAPAGAATFSAIYTEILTKGATGNCMFAACHGGPPDPAINGGLQIKAGDKAGAYKNLVDAKSPGAVCSGKTYVIPGDSAGSLLVQKLADAPPCGAKMPIGSPLTAAQVAQIANWVDQGAQDN
jgi:hypothetical protein